MNILINLSNHLISEALSDFLKKEQDGYQVFVATNNGSAFNKLGADNFRPDIILVDFNNINQKLFSQYPASKVILIDTGLKQEDIITTLLSYKFSGVLSAHTDIRLFRKALKVVSEGQIWIDNSTIKAFLHSAGLISKTGKINGITEKEKEIIEHISQGYRNKEIAQRLNISEQTVKAHLNRIFRKFNVSNRSQLITLAMNNRIA
jgi:DNA-binding NarL/FixJ family response regulator